MASRARVSLLGCVFLLLASDSVAADGIVLTLIRGPGAGQVTLQWTNGGALTDVYRSTTPQLLLDVANRIGQTSAGTWTDSPGAAPIHFYLVSPTGANCNPVNPAVVCGPNMHCFPHPDGVGTCSGPTGGGTQGTTCADDSGCAPPYACLFNGTSNVCLGWCRRASPSCPPGTSCIPLSPRVYIGADEFGVCF